jgi:hypothetical protein
LYQAKKTVSYAESSDDDDLHEIFAAMESSRPRRHGRQRAKTIVDDEDEDDYKEADGGAADEDEDGMSMARTMYCLEQRSLTYMVNR